MYIILACGIMMSLAARGYVLWLINIIFIAVLVKFALAMKNSVSKKKFDV